METARHRYTCRDHGFAHCENPTCCSGSVTDSDWRGEKGFLWRWHKRLLCPLTREDVRAGYVYELAFRQFELSDTRCLIVRSFTDLYHTRSEVAETSSPHAGLVSALEDSMIVTRSQMVRDNTSDGERNRLRRSEPSPLSRIKPRLGWASESRPAALGKEAMSCS